jgi:hypothetical protein
MNQFCNSSVQRLPTLLATASGWKRRADSVLLAWVGSVTSDFTQVSIEAIRIYGNIDCETMKLLSGTYMMSLREVSTNQKLKELDGRVFFLWLVDCGTQKCVYLNLKIKFQVLGMCLAIQI